MQSSGFLCSAIAAWMCPDLSASDLRKQTPGRGGGGGFCGESTLSGTTLFRHLSYRATLLASSCSDYPRSAAPAA